MVELQNVKDISKQINNLIAENEKLTYIKNRNSEVVEKLNNMIIELKSIMVVLNPTIKINGESQRGNKNGKLKPIIAELYEKLQSGTYLTASLIESIYRELNEKQISYILIKISKMPHVGKARDGGKLRLFHTII